MYLVTVLAPLYNKYDLSLFVQKPDLRTKHFRSDIEEDNNVKARFKIKDFPDSNCIREAA